MDFEQFRFSPGFDLSAMDTSRDGDMDRGALKDLRRELHKQLADYQERLYAESNRSLLVVLQAMDAAGKDSTIARLTQGLNAQGCHVHSFKKPSDQELAHDFLWRVHDKAPAAGEIAIFNRSHYEDVLIVKVHGWANAEKIQRRYQHIRNFESLLADRGTRIIKIMLHISRDYQLERFKLRLQDKEKHWKFNAGDLEERAYWDDYMDAFQTAMSNCSSAEAPWYVVPAENRRFRDVMVASLMLAALREMDPQHPKPDFDEAKYTSETIS